MLKYKYVGLLCTGFTQSHMKRVFALRLIKVDNIKENMELAKPIYSENHILLNRRMTNLLKYKKRLKDLGINYIYVSDEISQDIEVNDVIKEKTRHKCNEVVKETIENISFNKDIQIQKIKNSVEQIVDEILTSDSITVNMVNIKSFDSYTFEHSVNVTILSTILAKNLNLDKSELLKLGIGSMLHDIGKILIPEDIIHKPSSLTKKEYEIVKKHTTLGYNYLKKYYSLSPVSRTIVLLHHERIDGTGYPNGFTGEEIHKYAKIVAVADVFDALTSNRIYRNRWPINKAINYLISNSCTLFHKDYVTSFINNIAVYPNGTTVKLSNDKTAIVVEQNKNFPMRPIVKIIEDKKQKKYTTIDLMQQTNLVIVDVI